MTRHLAACIACFAMLFAALAPALSHATASPRAQIWTQICSASGAAVVTLSVADSAMPAPGEHDTSQLEHCPFCATHAASLALPPSAGFAIALIEAPASLPFLFFQSPRPLAIWTVAQSRGPPAA
ncbi:DUF2946 domain-containing protein [Massilia sp. DWR3-1-1]|uniref:DUF2946 domain-containing protein n=1 Tax=Massilia sp. DWR3-1-1 TaxID=2804559 RepID=UPI003CF63485